MKTTMLKLGFAAAVFAFGTAEDCGEGGDVYSYGCPSGSTCSTEEPDGLQFQSAGLSEALFVGDEVTTMATGGTQTVLLLDGSDGSPLEIPASVSMGGGFVTIASEHGNQLALLAGSQEGDSELAVTDPSTGDLFDRIAVGCAPVATASLTKSFNETLAGLDDGLPMLLAPGGIGVIGLHADGSASLLDDSMTVTGSAITRPRWDEFVVGDLAPGSYPLVATSNGQAFTLGFDVAAAPDRVALSVPDLFDDNSVQVGESGIACFSAFLGARYMHVAWTYAADNATVGPSVFEGCASFTPLVAGPVVVHATTAGMTIDLDAVGTAPESGHTRARAKAIGSRGERGRALAAD